MSSFLVTLTVLVTKNYALVHHCYFYYYGAIICSCGYCGIKSSNLRDHKRFSKISSSPLINKNVHFFKCFTAVNTFGASVSIFFLFYRDFQEKKYFDFIVLNGKLLQKWTGPYESREEELKNSKLHQVLLVTKGSRSVCKAGVQFSY